MGLICHHFTCHMIKSGHFSTFPAVVLRTLFSHHEVRDTGAHLRMTYLRINAHDVIQDGAEKVHEGTEHGVHIFIICMNYCLLWPAELSRIQGCLYYGGVCEDICDLNDSHVTAEWQANQPSAIMCCVGSLAIHLPVYSHPLLSRKASHTFEWQLPLYFVAFRWKLYFGRLSLLSQYYFYLSHKPHEQSEYPP